MANFPVLERVRVTDYGLYVGTPEKPGLDHHFVDGVNVIVGINGLGKTTLLNILLRALTGASDVPGGDEELGDKKRRLVPVERNWFRKRVPDDAVNAKVTIWFKLGQSRFEVTRSLANMDVTELWIDQQQDPNKRATGLEAAYRNAVAASAGLASFDDFVFILRYVIFYLEDRRSLVWDEAAQGDILGILFGEVGGRERYVELFNDVLSKDSAYRNMHAVVHGRRKKLEKQNSTIEGGQIEMLVKTLEERKDELKDLSARRNELIRTRDGLREQMENRRQEIHERRATLAAQLNTFYESFFPSLDGPARYLLAHFEAGTGCLVCGSKGEAVTKRVEAKLYLNICPVCDSPLENGQQPAHDPHAGEDIERQREEIAAAERDLEKMTPSLQAADLDYSTVAAELVSATAAVAGLEQQLKALGQSLPDVMQRRDHLASQMVGFEALLNQLDVEYAEAAEKFGQLAEVVHQEVEAVSANIERIFAGYISGFLAEQCEIKYSPRFRQLGQRSGMEQYPFPHFIPALTSGVHRNGATVREAGQSVSESQKEFIDLAFRMAILALAAPDAPTMLVLETPEASLDSVFVPRAADLLRRFATKTGSASETRLIASSNVNREEMIPALFGAYPDQRFYGQVVDEAPTDMPDMIAAEDREAHVLDLIKIAAPTRALERFREAYEAERDLAIYPERREGNRAA
ncbi:AAA family ATPase [Roseateles sp.]|uniref:AAA family ATPase n=1 Tax=Roseateles sp. TaxID=1971397 RepID=UPI0039E78FC3